MFNRYRGIAIEFAAVSTTIIGVFLSMAGASTAEAFHSEIVTLLATNARIVEPPRRHTVGPFPVTAVNQMAGGAIPIRVAIYTAPWSDYGQYVALGGARVAAEPQGLPTLTIDPPEDFYRSAGSDANVQWYDSTIVNATLRIYSFRLFTGDASRVFHETLFGDWTNLDPVTNLAGPPVFSRGSMAGADAVFAARFLDINGRSHMRLAIVANGGRAVAIVHLRAETPSGIERVLPSTIKVLSSMRVTTGPPRLSGGPAGVDTRAVAGLYVTPRLKMLSATGSVASTYYYLFSPDGRVYRGYGLPKAAGGDIHRFDYAAAAREDPENAGTFEVRGDQLVIRMGWQHPYLISTKIPDSEGKVTIENSTFSLQLR